MNNKDLLKLLLHTVELMNGAGVLTNPIRAHKSTIIYGKKSSIDSLSFINLLVSFEEQLSFKYYSEVDLFDEISQTSSKFSNLEDLANLAFQKLINKSN